MNRPKKNILKGRCIASRAVHANLAPIAAPSNSKRGIVGLLIGATLALAEINWKDVPVSFSERKYTQQAYASEEASVKTCRLVLSIVPCIV